MRLPCPSAPLSLPCVPVESEEVEEPLFGVLLDEVFDEVFLHGDGPEGSNRPEGERLYDSQNIYGSGKWFVVGTEWIWAVRNNGMDGDCWAWNNVVTGGAGAIGRRVPCDAELAARIRQLASETGQERTEWAA